MGMSKDSPDQPAAPDPGTVTAAQTAANEQTARTQANLNRYNSFNPFQATTWNNLGNDRWEQITSLNPTDQESLDQQRAIRGDMGNLASDQLGRIRSAVGTPLDYEGLTTGVSELPVPQLYAGAPDLFGSAGFDRYAPGADPNAMPGQYGELERGRVEDAIYSRLTPQFDRDRARLETQLANQGIPRNSEAWNAAMDEHNRSLTDARMQAVLAGGSEQSRLFGMEMSGDQARNAALRDQFGLNTSAANFQNAGRAREFGERAAVRNVPLADFAFLSGTSGSPAGVTAPQSAPISVQPTDTMSPINTQYAAQVQAANQAAARRMGVTNGLFGLGAASLGGWAASGFA